jgi:hypothetical protein
MTSLNNKYTNNRSMNGLINIYADNIEATNSVVNNSLTVGGVDINDIVNQVETNTINLTGITYDGSALPVPRTTIDNEIYTNSNLVVGGTATVDNSFICNSFVEITGTTTIGDDVDMTGSLTIRDPINPTISSMTISYNAPTFRFLNNQPNGYIAFNTQDGYGNIGDFSFNSGQVYTNLFTYIANWLAISYNNQIIMGDGNFTGVWFGMSQRYVPNPDPGAGFIIYNKGLMNNTAYYTNFLHSDLFNNEVYTFRMNYANIWSKVKHICEDGIDITGNIRLGPSYNCILYYQTGGGLSDGLRIENQNSNDYTNLYSLDSSSTLVNTFRTHYTGVYSLVPFTCEGTSTFNGDTEFNAFVAMNSTLSINANVIANSTTITPLELSYLDGTIGNIQTQLNAKINATSNNTFTGTNTFSNTVTFTGNVIANSLTITPTELSYIDGTTSNIQTQLNSKSGLSSNNTFSGTNTFPSITFNDASVQATAYTNTKNTKLDAIGTVVTGTLTTATLTSGTFYSAGSITLTVGTWIINTNACFSVITGSTTIGQILACPSISSSSISGVSRLSINQLNSQNFGIGSQWVLTSSNIYTPTVTTNYFCLVQASFGTASRLQFLSTNSRFEAYRIA